MTKLESHNLDNITQPVPEVNQIDDCLDSGTETDDETGGPDEDMDYTYDDPSDVTRGHSYPATGRPASTPVYATGAALDLEVISSEQPGGTEGKENVHHNGILVEVLDHEICSPTTSSAGFREYVRPAVLETFQLNPGSSHSDNDGNHSSEEELEEINKVVEKHFVVDLPDILDEEDEELLAHHDTLAVSAALSPSSFSSTTSTSSMSNSSGGNTPALPEIGPVNPAAGCCSSSSSVEEGATGHCQLVQFSTSPPTGNHVHKPRRSLSPPPKMMLMEQEEEVPTIHSHSSKIWCPASLESRGVEQLLVGGEEPQQQRKERRAISPKKRYRQSRVHHIQRPCLDFEKMQQLKTRAVTSWRHGGELSLFCW